MPRLPSLQEPHARSHERGSMAAKECELGRPLGTEVVLKYSSTWWVAAARWLYINLQSRLESHQLAIMSWTCQVTNIKSILIRSYQKLKRFMPYTNRSMHRPRRCTHNCPTLDHQLLPSITPPWLYV